MKKRVISFITACISALICVFGLAGCGGKDDLLNFVFKKTENGDGYEIAECWGYDGYELALTELTVPSSYKKKPVVSIGYGAFANMISLKKLTLPPTIKHLNLGAFAYDYITGGEVHISDLASWCEIDFEGSLLEVFSTLYLNDEPVERLVIPDGVTTIKRSAFEGCTSLVSLTVPASVTKVEEAAFRGCVNLAEVYNLSQCDIFNGYEVGIELYTYYTSLDEPSAITITDDGYYFFSKDDGLYTGEYILLGCRGNITDAVLPEDCEGNFYSIRMQAFRRYRALQTVTLPPTLLNIGFAVFEECFNLQRINYTSTIHSWLALNKEINWNYQTDCHVYCTDGIVYNDGHYMPYEWE